MLRNLVVHNFCRSFGSENSLGYFPPWLGVGGGESRNDSDSTRYSVEGVDKFQLLHILITSAKVAVVMYSLSVYLSTEYPKNVVDKF